MAAKKAVTKKAQRSFTESDVVDFLMKVPEIQEAYTRADVEIAIDNRGWERLGGYKNAAEVDSATRNSIINTSRLYWRKDPLAKQAVRIWTDYGVGSGMEFNAEDEATQAKLQKFCNNRRNKQFMDERGQQRSSKKLLVDGEVFFALFGTDEGKTIRYIDPMQVTDVVTDPNDDEHVLCYRRCTAADKTFYYADWRATAEDRTLAETIDDPVTRTKIKLETDVVVLHAAFDQFGRRGNGLISSAVDWSREHRRFMESRAAITQALAKFAWKVTAKGGQQTLNTLKTSLQSSLVNSGAGVERNPVNAPAGMWLQNMGMDMAPMPRVTGGSEARDDSDSFKLMVSAATNVMLHYFGDPSTGNLATATSMELPMLKSFTSYQNFWISVYRDIFSIVLDENIDEEIAVIDIDLPPILDDDLTKLGAYITQVATVFPEIKVPAVLKVMLVALKINNIDEVMKAMEDKRVELDDEREKQVEMLAKQPTMTPAQQALNQEAQLALAEALNGVAAKL